MAAFERNVIPMARHSVQCTRHDRLHLSIRSFSTTLVHMQDTPAATAKSPTEHKYNPNLVHTPSSERRLFEQQRRLPIGSRRRRAALVTSARIPFEQLPYQCFQEARKIIQQDRKEMVDDIHVQRERIARLTATEVAPQDEANKERRLGGMRDRLERLKIYADINDPLVKKKFEDGQGDMNKPIYRHLADLKWRSYKRKLLVQRIEQMNVVPDVLPTVDPVVSTSLAFGSRKVPHGDFVESRVSEIAPTIDIQPYDAGARLVTIAVVTPDVPVVATDGFEYRCHFLASNVVISPTTTRIKLGSLDAESQIVLPWLPPYSQKGAPYQRMAIFILEQPQLSSPAAKDVTSSTTAETSSTSPTRSVSLDVPGIKAKYPSYTERENFILRSYATRFRLHPVGADLFRSKWDEGTAGVMQRLGVPGADVEFRRKRVEPLPYKRLKSERYR